MTRNFTRRVQTSSAKPNASQQQAPSQRTGTMKQPTNTTTTSSSGPSNLVPPSQQQRWTPPQPNSGLPAQSVWGKQQPPAPPEPRPSPKPSPQILSHASKPGNIVNNNNNNNNHQSQPTGSNKKESIRILQKKNPEAAVTPPSNLNSQARKLPGKDQDKPKGAISTVNKAKQQPKASKPTKNKPQLQTMSLGDMMVVKPT